MSQTNTIDNPTENSNNSNNGATESASEASTAVQPEHEASHSDDDSSIHDFDFTLICEYFASINRQGPGSDKATRRALSFVPGINAHSRIADIGCGTGSSALLLAHDTGAQVTAIDLFPQFLTQLSARAEDAGVSKHITTAAASMDALDYAEASFDLLWCEGAIYNIGFEKGLRLWRPMLKDGGYIAVTDATWLTDDRPAEVEAFWHDAYPGITDMAGNLAAIQRCGYTPAAAFVLPDECWTENFYEPQRQAQDIFLSRHGDDKTAQALVANQRHEAEIFSRFHQYYGYAFYIARKS